MTMAAVPAEMASLPNRPRNPNTPARAQGNRIGQRTARRPQLSCRTCRDRKVKCDRLVPCSACSTHQSIHECIYDLPPGARQPILLADALRGKERELIFLRDSLAAERAAHNLTRYRLRQSQGRDLGVGWQAINMEPPPAIERNEPALELDTFLTREHLRQQARPAANPNDDDEPLLQRLAPYPLSSLWSLNGGIGSLFRSLPRLIDDTYKYIETFVRCGEGICLPYTPACCAPPAMAVVFSRVSDDNHTDLENFAVVFAVMAKGAQFLAVETADTDLVRELMLRADVYARAAMHVLHLVSYQRNPTLGVLETLLLLNSFLCSAGHIAEANSLFADLVVIGFSMNLDVEDVVDEENPIEQTQVPDTPEARGKLLWRIICNTDAHYAQTLGRPLLIQEAPSNAELQIPAVFVPFLGATIRLQHEVFGVVREALQADEITQEMGIHFCRSLASMLDTMPNRVQVSTHVATASLVELNRQDAITAVEICCSINGAIMAIVPKVVGPDLLAGNFLRQQAFVAARQILNAFLLAYTRLKSSVISWTLCLATVKAVRLLGPVSNQDKNEFRRVNAAFAGLERSKCHHLAGIAHQSIAKAIDRFGFSERGNNPLAESATTRATTSGSSSASTSGQASTRRRPTSSELDGEGEESEEAPAAPPSRSRRADAEPESSNKRRNTGVPSFTQRLEPTYAPAMQPQPAHAQSAPAYSNGGFQLGPPFNYGYENGQPTGTVGQYGNYSGVANGGHLTYPVDNTMDLTGHVHDHRATGFDRPMRTTYAESYQPFVPNPNQNQYNFGQTGSTSTSFAQTFTQPDAGNLPLYNWEPHPDTVLPTTEGIGMPDNVPAFGGLIGSHGYPSQAFNPGETDTDEFAADQPAPQRGARSSRGRGGWHI